MSSRVMVVVARALKAYRKSENVTQEEAANRIGCSLPTYRYLEQGVSEVGQLPDPKLSTFMRALTTLGLDEPVLKALEHTLSSEGEDSATHLGGLTNAHN
ncbi:MAG: helix-turn-helix transcriptional regulator [Rhodoglobus sp.]|uniref:helix-turn-helix domain-containing protein n=1 Tax=unclassified Microbacterium TaxID=2609290 RepID=UPI00141A6F60|nr:helix-turn-helix transcriptional regulator [Microbacterium sp. 3H14]MDZ4045683.1 helix-turn-helix transcriptional regulator [Rhodoglobus sp.]